MLPATASRAVATSASARRSASRRSASRRSCADGAAPVGGGVARGSCHVVYLAGRSFGAGATAAGAKSAGLARRWCGLCVPSRCSAPSAGTRCCTTTTVAATAAQKACHGWQRDAIFCATRSSVLVVSSSPRSAAVLRCQRAIVHNCRCAAVTIACTMPARCRLLRT